MCVPAYGVPRVVVCGWRAASGSSGSDGFGGIPPCAAEGDRSSGAVHDPPSGRPRGIVRPDGTGRHPRTVRCGTPGRRDAPRMAVRGAGGRARSGERAPAAGRARRTGPGAAACLAEGPGTGHAVRMSRAAYGANLGNANRTGPDKARTDQNRTTKNGRNHNDGTTGTARSDDHAERWQ